MPKRAAASQHPKIDLDASSSVPLYKQLYERLRAAILAGQLGRGARLPSTRSLASELGVSRNTTALAYELLLLEGYVQSKVGQGTIVSPELPAWFTTAAATKKKVRPSTPVHLAAQVRTLTRVTSSNPAVHSLGIFRVGEAALDLFPYKLWARLVARRARLNLREFSRYQELQGYMPLRAAIAAHIGITRGVRCTPEQILITAGSQGALNLAIQTLLNPGDAAWIENPGYFGAQGALLAAGADLVPVPVDEQGLNVAKGRGLRVDARLASTTPSHQYPTGVTMSLNRRLALLEWAQERGAWILEDDYDSEYRFSGRPLEALQGLDSDGRVLYIGSFSKTLFPALRLGYLIAPSALIDPLLQMRRFTDIHLPILEQMALTDFLEEGHFARHLRRMHTHYERRREVLRSELAAQLGGLLEVFVPEAGMHLVGWLPPGRDDRKIAARAVDVGLSLSYISKYSLTPLQRGGLLFGYAGTSEAAIRTGVQRLAAVMDRET